MAQSLPSVSPQQHLLLTVSLTKSCLGQLSLPTNPPAHQPNPTGEHTSWYSSFLAHSPNFWLTQGLWWHSAEWKKSMCSRRWWKSPAVLLLSWLFSELCLASALSKHAAGQPTGHSSAWPGTRCMLLPQQRNTAWLECSLGESHLPLLLSSHGSHRLIPIDHVWRVGEKNNLPHGSSTTEPGFQRLWLAKLKAGPLSSAVPRAQLS